MLRTLRWDYPGISRWGKYNHDILKKGMQEGKKRGNETTEIEVEWWALKMEEGATSQGMRQPLKNEQGKETIPRSMSWGSVALQTLWFGPGETHFQLYTFFQAHMEYSPE